MIGSSATARPRATPFAAPWYVRGRMPEPESDGELVRRITAAVAEGNRDAAAEGELCRRFAPRIRLYGLRHLRSEDRARDLVQAVLLGLIEAARSGRIQAPDQVDRFVLGTCRNVALRRHAIESRTTAVDDAELELSIVLPEPERVDTSALVRCLAALDLRARTVVQMSFNDEKSAEEIARLLSLSAGNVRVVRHRAVAQLRRCLDTAGPARALGGGA